MFIGHINHFASEKSLLPTQIVKALVYLQEQEFSRMKAGRYEIDGDNMIAILSEYETLPKKDKKIESHQSYLDVQFVQTGEEMMGYGPLIADLEILEEYSKEQDVVFYRTHPLEMDIKVSEGMYVVFFPWDVHRPGCMTNETKHVRKVVIKIKMNS